MNFIFSQRTFSKQQAVQVIRQHLGVKQREATTIFRNFARSTYARQKVAEPTYIPERLVVEYLWRICPETFSKPTFSAYYSSLDERGESVAYVVFDYENGGLGHVSLYSDSFGGQIPNLALSPAAALELAFSLMDAAEAANRCYHDLSTGEICQSDVANEWSDSRPPQADCRNQ